MADKQPCAVPPSAANANDRMQQTHATIDANHATHDASHHQFTNTPTQSTDFRKG